MRCVRCIPILLLATACATSSGEPVPAPEPAADEGTFTLTMNGNPIVTERFRRTPNRLEGEIALPTGGRATYTAQLRSDASVSAMELRQYGPGEAEPAYQAAGTFTADSIHITQQSGDSTQTAVRATPAGSIPYLNPSPALLEQIVRRARAIGVTNVQVPVWLPSGGGQSATVAVVFSASDSVRLTLAGTPILLQIDQRNRVLGGSVPSQNVTITRSD